MNYNILSTRRFTQELKRLVRKYPSLQSEFVNLLDKMEEQPTIGTYISSNCYKIRLV